MLFSETALLLLYSCKQQVLLWQQQIFRTSNLGCSKQQSVLIISHKQLELVNYKLKIPSLSTLMFIEQYIFLLSHSKIYSARYCHNGGMKRCIYHNLGQVSFSQSPRGLGKGLFCQRFLYTINMKWGLGY